jgi:hypothetical protein
MHSYMSNFDITISGLSGTKPAPRNPPRILFSVTAASKAALKHNRNKLNTYEQWKRFLAVARDDPMALNPLKYWQLHMRQYPTLVKFIINVLIIPASAVTVQAVGESCYA